LHRQKMLNKECPYCFKGKAMSDKHYGWHGWKMPILHPNDPDFCEFGCPICVPARHGNKLARAVQKIELAVTFGGCWWGRARQRKYGVAPDQMRPSK
jgi:hypothetical protein